MLIIHRCGTCKQPDYWRDNTGDTAGDTVDGQPVTTKAQRTCCNRSRNWGPPETAPRWRSLTLEPVAEVLPPGDKAGGNATTCDCDDCWALYRELVPDATPSRHLAAVPG